MKSMIAAAVAALTVGLGARQAAPASVAGTWTMTLQIQGGNSFTSTLDLKLDGKAVTGTVESQMGTSPVTGQFADGRLTLTLTYNSQQGPMQASYTATLKDDRLTGTASIGQIEIPWTAERVKAATPSPAAAPIPAGVTGKWTMALELPVIGSASPELDLKQDGEKITGTYTGRYGTTKVEGTIKDHAIEFSTTVDAEGTAAKMSFWGELASDGQTMIKGTAQVEGLGDATWTATRVKS